jgi:hypothetical protein
MLSIPVLLGLFGSSAALVALNESASNNKIPYKEDQSIIWTNYITKIPNPKINNIPKISLDGNLVDSGFKVDDQQSGNNILWSSEKILNQSNVADDDISNNTTWSSKKIATELNKNSLEYQWRENGKTAEGNVAMFDSFGNSKNSGFTINDEFAPSDFTLWSSKKILNSLPVLDNVDDSQVGNNLWSSKKIYDEITSFFVQNSKENNIVTFDNTGKMKDSEFYINDNETSNKNLWTSVKTVNFLQNYQKKVTPLNINSFGIIDESGQIQDSGIILNDTLSESPDVMWSSTKISSLFKKFFLNSYLDSTQISPGDNLPNIPNWNKNVFSCPKDGKYMFVFVLYFTDLEISANVKLTNNTIPTYFINNQNTIHGTQMYDLKLNDIIEFRIVNNGPNIINLSSPQSTVTISEI